MAYCVHTICIGTGFKLHFATTYNSSNIKKGNMQTCFGGKWIVPISMKTIKNELVRSRKMGMHRFDFQFWRRKQSFLFKTPKWHFWPKQWTHFFSNLKHLSFYHRHHHHSHCNLCGKLGDRSDILSSWSLIIIILIIINIIIIIIIFVIIALQFVWKVG